LLPAAGGSGRARRRHCRRAAAGIAAGALHIASFHRPQRAASLRPGFARSTDGLLKPRALRRRFHSRSLSMPTFPVATPRASCLSVAIVAALLLPLPASGQETPITQLQTVRVEDRLDPAESERARTPGNVSVVDGETFHERAVNNMADS